MIQDSPLYLFFRPLIKYIVHLLTGQTQIQRKSRVHDIQGLQRSILLSKVLVSYRNNHFEWSVPFNQDFAEQLCAIKHINNEDAKFRVKNALNQLYSWKYALNQINKMKSQKYDSNIEHHQQMLMDIWTKLRPERNIKNRKSEEWIELGFQVEDPATDFRGAGYLGLMNLHEWVSTQAGRQAFKVADTKGTDYFFASASLFLTMLTFELVKTLQISAWYWIDHQQKSQFKLFQNIFNHVFVQFASFWLQVQDKSMMQFNINLLNFAKILKSQRILSFKAAVESKIEVK